jgi:hypothetical protein
MHHKTDAKSSKKFDFNEDMRSYDAFYDFHQNVSFHEQRFDFTFDVGINRKLHGYQYSVHSNAVANCSCHIRLEKRGKLKANIEDIIARAVPTNIHLLCRVPICQ